MWLLYAPNVDKKKPHAKNKFELLPLQGDDRFKPKAKKLTKAEQIHIKNMEDKLNGRR